MTKTEFALCNGIIHSASLAAAGVGVTTRISISDDMVITPIQLTMVVSLGKVFGLNLDQSTAKSSIASATATKLGKKVSQMLAGLLPGVGNIINAATAASITEVMGWIMAKQFDISSKSMLERG